MKFINHLPVVGIAVALCLFVVAASRYPGGTMGSAGTVGFSWTHNFLSSLFQPRALNGAPNPARPVAISAMLVLCASLGMVFYRISTKARSRAHRKVIEIGGIGAAVYGFFIATPMHNLMISIGLLFSLTALVATTYMLYKERRWLLFGWGTLCLALLLLSAVMYYGNALYGVLPVVQKVSLASCVGWLLSVYYAQLGQEG
jgi:hypothetical protein